MISSTSENSLGWKDFWANAMVEKFDHLVTDAGDSRSVILLLLDAVELGNSCIQISHDRVSALGGLVSDSPLKKAPFHFDGDLLYMDQHFQLETVLVENVRRIIEAESIQLDSGEFEYLLTDEHQKRSLQVVFKNNFNLITGGPGTGKTYTLARIIASLNKVCDNPRIAMAAPTGKAAQRMQEALQNAFSSEALNDGGFITDELKSLVPITIHRLLGIGMNGKAQFGADKKLPFDILVVDEVSMLDLKIAAQLFSAVASGTRVILLGDPKQLASVDVGGLLLDLKSSPLLKNNQVQLEKSVRFGDDTAIGRIAKFILRKSDQATDQATDQVVFDHFSDNSDHSVVEEFKKLFDGESAVLDMISANGDGGEVQAIRHGYMRYTNQIHSYLSGLCDHDELFTVFDQYRVLTATKHGKFGLNDMNTYISSHVAQVTGQDSREWYVGRPIMITENNYKLGLSNGDIGICLKHRENSGEFEVYFQSSNKWISTTRLPKSIQTAYAMTIHKSQGSEFGRVAVVLDDSEASSKVLSMELIYTAITRAKNEIYLLAGDQALLTALTVKTTRQSGLQKKLQA